MIHHLKNCDNNRTHREQNIKRVRALASRGHSSNSIMSVNLAIQKVSLKIIISHHCDRPGITLTEDVCALKLLKLKNHSATKSPSRDCTVLIIIQSSWVCWMEVERETFALSPRTGTGLHRSEIVKFNGRRFFFTTFTPGGWKLSVLPRSSGFLVAWWCQFSRFSNVWCFSGALFRPRALYKCFQFIHSPAIENRNGVLTEWYLEL